MALIDEIIENMWQEYVSQPSNFGSDDHSTRLAEEDAYKAGAYAIYSEFVPF